MKLIHLWVIMAMITAGYGLVNKEQTASYAVVALVLPFVMWPLLVGAELHNIKNELIGDRK
jgi:hypothetical protein